MDNSAMTSKNKDLLLLQKNGEAQLEMEVFHDKNCEPSGEDSSRLKSMDAIANMTKDAQSLHLPLLHLTPSPASQKKFLFVDCVGGRNTIYLHPSMLKDLSLGSKGSTISDLLVIFEEFVPADHLPIKDLVFLHDDQCGDFPEIGVAFEKVVSSAYGALDEMLTNRERLSSLDEMRSTSPLSLAFTNAEAQCKGTNSLNINNLPNTNDASHSSLHEDSDDLEALLDCDDEASSDEAVISSEDEMSTGQSAAFDKWLTGCESPCHTENNRAKEKRLQKNVYEFEQTDEDSVVVSFAESLDMPFFKHKQGNVPYIGTVPVSARNFPPQFPELDSPTSFQSNNESDGTYCLSEEVSNRNTMKRLRLTQKPCVHYGTAKKPRSCPFMPELQLIQGVVPALAGDSEHGAVTYETISHETSKS